MFDSTSTSKLGMDECSLYGKTRLKATLQHFSDVKIAEGSSLSFLAGSLTSSSGLSSLAVQELTVEPPVDKQPPTVSILGSSELGLCPSSADMLWKAQATGAGKQTYEWTVDGISQNLASTAESLQLEDFDLSIGSQVTICLLITDLFGDQATACLEVSRSTLAKPTLMIKSPMAGAVIQPHETSEFIGSVDAIPSCQDDGSQTLDNLRLVYKWILPSGITLTPDASRHSRVLQLPANTLSPDTAYEFELQAYSNNTPGNVGSEKFSFTTSPLPAVQCDAGTSRDVWMGEELELDASGSSDPAGSALEFSWSCFDISKAGVCRHKDNGVPLTAASTSDFSKFAVPADSFDAGSYQWRLEVRVDDLSNRIMQACTVDYTVKDVSVVKVHIDADRTKYNNRQLEVGSTSDGSIHRLTINRETDLVLKCLSATSSIEPLTWSLPSGDIATTNPTFQDWGDSSFLWLAPGSLSYGLHTFQCTGTALAPSNVSSGAATFNVRVPEPPKGGTCIVSCDNTTGDCGTNGAAAHVSSPALSSTTAQVVCKDFISTVSQELTYEYHATYGKSPMQE